MVGALFDSMPSQPDPAPSGGGLIMIDRVMVAVQSGNGGAGAVSFRREKFVPKGGPDGGDGGKGGDVCLVATHQLQTLMDLSTQRQYQAPHGQPGGKKKCYGTDGTTLMIRVPCGTMVFNGDDLIADLTHEGDTVCVAKGGKGGQGNARFATSVNQAPRYAQPGMPGESASLRLELRLIANVGLVGVPNAGKSSLLNRLTHANPKVADYPFTTLFPNLGVLRWYDQEVVIADIPGLIEGAANGAGLGATFLRHVDRTQLLVHLVPISPGDPQQTWQTYTMLSAELAQSPYQLPDKPMLVALSKVDLIDEDELAAHMAPFLRCMPAVFPLSNITRQGLEPLIQAILERKPHVVVGD